MDETVLEIATDKVDSEVPSTAEGVLSEILFKENDVVPIGTVIARIETNGAAVGGNKPAAQAQAQQPQQVPFVPSASAQPAPSAGANKFYSPLVLNIANSEGVSMAELE